VDLSGDDDPADKMNHSHALEVVGSVESRGVRNRESSVKVSSSGDAPCTREVGTGEEGGSVFGKVVDDIINDFLRKPRAAGFAHPEDPPYLPVEALASEP